MQPIERMYEEMDRFLGDYGSAFPFSRARNNGHGVMTTRLDLSETEDAIEVTLDVPGIAEKDIDLRLSDNTLFVQGKRSHEAEEKGKNYHRVERSFGTFHRRIPLPTEIDPDDVRAKLTAGVLTVTLPKTHRARAQDKRITIST